MARRFLVRGASARTAKWAGTRRRGSRDVATALHGTIRLPARPPEAALHRQGRAAPARSRRRERARSGSRQAARHMERGAQKARLSYYSIVTTNAKMSDEAPTTPLQAPTETAATTGVVSEDQVKLALRRVKDPDLQLNIIDLGLVYRIAVDGTTVKVDMTLTSPACPSGPELMTNAEREVMTLPGVEKVDVNLVWMPFWTPEKMEPRVRAYLGF